MKIKFLISKLIFTILLIISFSSAVFAQNTFKYLSVEFNYSNNDSINYLINSSGLDNTLKTKLEPYSNKKIKLKTENELFNALGKLGWELYLIEDRPNKISPASNYAGEPMIDHYNLYRDGEFSKRIVYFKIKT